MKRYILQRVLDGLYCCDAAKHNNWNPFTPNIAEARLYTKKEARTRVFFTKDVYLRLTVLDDR